MEKKIDELKTRRAAAKRSCEFFWKQIEDTRDSLNTLVEVYAGHKKNYEEADRELAEIDGRLKIINGRRDETTMLLTRLNKDQITRICQVLEDEMKGGEEDEEGSDSELG